MTKPISPPVANRGPIPISSISTALPYDPQIQWVQVTSAGSGGLVVKDEAGTARTYASLVAGQTLYGPFTELTSMTCSSILAGDGRAPTLPPGVQNYSSALTNKTTVSGAVDELEQDAHTTLTRIPLPPSSWYLATGAAVAAFSNGASAVPGSSVTNTKAFGLRWNNNSTLNGVIRSFDMPPDADITKNMVIHVRASKVGATLGDAVTFDVNWWNQVDGALHDAATDAGGTTSAMQGDAATKTMQNVTLTVLAAALSAAPTSVSILVKPTDGTLGTDDLLVSDVFVQYTRKLQTT